MLAVFLTSCTIYVIFFSHKILILYSLPNHGSVPKSTSLKLWEILLICIDLTVRIGKDGVFCLFREAFLSSVSEPRELSADALCIDLITPTKIRLVLIYRPPKSCIEEDDKLIDYLSCLCSITDPVVVLGDFNIDVDWFNQTSRSPSAVKFSRFFNI